MLSFIGITILVVLGCHIQNIQQDRLSTAISFANSLNIVHQNGTRLEPIWFLTGGVKNAIDNYIEQSEASKMATELDVTIKQVVLDTNAKNTAENFVNLKRWISMLEDKTNLNVVITTSSFHQNRAKKIFDGIFHDIDIMPHWNLGAISCPHCESDEFIHIRNVDNDVKKALSLFKKI
jgi:uncharacterized SAM-binding protein YcdF (DUF218 family)